MSGDRHQIKPYPIRMPDELRMYLEAKAKEKGRSLHSEVIRRLEESVHADRKKHETTDFVSDLSSAAHALLKISNRLSRDPALKDLAGLNQRPLGASNREYDEEVANIRARVLAKPEQKA